MSLFAENIDTFFSDFEAQTIESLVNQSKKRVVGQDEFLLEYLLQFKLLLKRMDLYRRGESPRDLIANSALLIKGPTASGKTFIVEEVSDMLDIKRFSANSTLLTGSGWRGLSVDEILYEVSQFQSNYPEVPCLILWDEFDKTRISTHEREPSFNPQPGFLKYLDGGNGGVYEGYREDKDSTPFTLNTNYVISVFAGAFTGIEDLPQDKNASNYQGFKPGFNTVPSKNSEDFQLEGVQAVSTERLNTWGIIRELIGRIGWTYDLPALSKEALIGIVLDSEQCLRDTYQKLFPRGVKFIIDREVAEFFAENTLAEGLGVRNLDRCLHAFVPKLINACIKDPTICVARLQLVDGRVESVFEFRDLDCAPAKPKMVSTEQLRLDLASEDNAQDTNQEHSHGQTA